MSLWKSIFSTPDVVKETISGVKEGIDKAFFTDQEKAEWSVKVGEWFIKYLNATQPQNLARRILAFMIAGLWVFLVLVLVCAYPFSEEYAAFVFTVLKDVVTIPFAGIMAFYFTTHLLRSRNGGDKD